MLRFVARRLLLLIPVLFGISVLVFVLVHMAPGNPVVAELGIHPTALEETRIADQLGLNQPLPYQYLLWIGRVTRGDLGTSIYLHTPVSSLILQALPTTASLTGASMLLALVIGLPVGVVSATRRGGIVDRGGRLFAVLGISMPIFWLGLLLIIAFSLQLRLFPPGGSLQQNGPIALVLPSISLGASFAAIIIRLTRSSILDVLGEDYVRTARGKGLLNREVEYRHVLRNALIPVVTVTGLQLGTLLSGAVITETVFSLPGLGRLMTNAVGDRDYPLIMGSVLVVAVLFVLANLLVDVLYAVIDPRLRLS